VKNPAAGKQLLAASYELLVETQTQKLNHKVEKPIFISLRGPKAVDDKDTKEIRRAVGLLTCR